MYLGRRLETPVGVYYRIESFSGGEKVRRNFLGCILVVRMTAAGELIWPCAVARSSLWACITVSNRLAAGRWSEGL